MRKRRPGIARKLWVSMLVVLSAGLLAAFAGAGGFSVVDITSSQGNCGQAADGSISCDLGTLPAGAMATVQISVTADEAGTICDTATAAGEQPDTNTHNNQDSVCTTVLGVVDLELQKKDSKDPVILGQPFTYTLTVVNNGPSIASGIVITDTLPTGVTVDSASGPSGCSVSANIVSCYIGTLMPGASATATISVVPHVVGTLINCAKAFGNEHDPNPHNNKDCEKTTVKQPPRAPETDVHVQKKGMPNPAKVGDTVMYTILVTNAGPDDATNVVVNDIIQHSGN